MNRYRQQLRPVWVEIDLEAVRHNLGEVRRLVGPRVEIMAVVKAEAYGHGAVEVAKTALDAGAAWLGVAFPEEGIALRKAGITAPILVFGPLQTNQVQAAPQYELTMTVCLLEPILALSRAAVKLGKTARVHLKIDTGMGRVGVNYQDAFRFMRHISGLPGIEVSGVYSHLATADQADKEFAGVQIKRFTEAVAQLKTQGLLPEKVHLANSAAVIDLPGSYFNLVRPGIMLYGLYPSPEVDYRERVSLRPVFSLKARTIFVKRVPAGVGISYGLKYQTKKETTIATIPIGYADGWSRLLLNKAEVLIGGRKFPIVGAICMDQCMVDVGDAPVEVGQEAVLIGNQGEGTITADQIASQLGTINYEVTCMIGDRVPRVYRRDEK